MSSYNDDDATPTLKRWRVKSNGKIRGSVHGHPDHKNGTRITVTPASPISNENLPEGYLLPTLGNHNYRLGTSESTENAANHEAFLSKIAALMASVTAEHEASTTRHEAFLAKWHPKTSAALMAPATATIDPSTPSTPITRGDTSLTSPPDCRGDVTLSAPTPPPPSGVIETKNPAPNAAYGGNILTGRNNDKGIPGHSPDFAQRFNLISIL